MPGDRPNRYYQLVTGTLSLDNILLKQKTKKLNHWVCLKDPLPKDCSFFEIPESSLVTETSIPPYPQNPADIWGGVGNGSRLVGWIVVLLSLLRRELGLHFSSAILAWSGAVSIFRLIPLRPNWAATGGDRSVTNT